MECSNCEEVKLDENYVCKQCKLKLCRFCEEGMYDHYENRMCDFVMKTIVKYVLDT